MEKKLTIKEIEMPYVLVGDEERRFELLCEFQAKDGAFRRAYVQEDGEDVIIEAKRVDVSRGPGKESAMPTDLNGGEGYAEDERYAIVGLFSTAHDKVGKLFDYIEASLNGKDGFVCWQSGQFERLLEQASKEGGKYPLVQIGIGLEDKVPMFYRQRVLDSVTIRAIEAHTVDADFIEESAEDLDGEMFFSEPEPDEVFDAPPKVTQARLLPEGWKWVDYPDLSGCLQAPVKAGPAQGPGAWGQGPGNVSPGGDDLDSAAMRQGEEFFIYEVSHAGYVEYKRDINSRWSRYPGRFEDFKHGAEKAILENLLKDVGGVSMDKMKFYVIDDLKQRNFSIEYVDGVAEAWERFMEAKADAKKLPALGVQVGDGSLNLLHGVNGDAVLVTDYRDARFNFSESMMEKIGDIEEAVRWLVMDGGGISYEYQNGIVPAWMQGDVNVLVPVTLGEKAPSSYCDDKVLKATVGTGLDAIDSLYMENHSWVAYDELLRHPDEYVADGTIKVQYLNVNYVNARNVVGIDGQMDISPCEFKGMVEKINKPYALVAYDGAKYTGSFRDKHEFIVASFETAAEAVKGWYEVQERKRVPMLVESHVPGEDRVVFNGYDENDKRMSYEEAAGKFGLDLKGLDAVLGDAENRAGMMKRVCEQDKELE